MPDYFVPLDTMQYTSLHRKLAAKSIIINANLKYVDNNRDMLKRKYPTFDKFRAKFEVPQSMIDDILKEGEKQKIKPKNEAELKQTIPFLKMQLKALVARDIWDMSEYFAIVNETNDIVEKAVGLMK